jgi:GT2 family glycosyltransferase
LPNRSSDITAERPASVRASRRPTSIGVSIVVPAYNCADQLGDCLAALPIASSPDVEVIVVDDGSTDNTLAVAEASGARVVSLTRNAGPAAARNAGVRESRGKLLLFIDADVRAPADIAARVEDILSSDSGIDAVFGSYDETPQSRGFVSQFRNLLHHYVHQTSEVEARTFWSGCGAIRREAFDSIGGFDEGWPAIEDIELGYRLKAAGRRVRLVKDLQVKHLKHWTLWSMMRTDLKMRALPWSRLILSRRVAPNDLNIKSSQRASVMLVALALVCAVLAVASAILLWVAGSAIAMVVAINRAFYAFLARKRGVGFALASIPLHLLYFVVSGVGFLWAWLMLDRQQSPMPPPGALLDDDAARPRRVVP